MKRVQKKFWRLAMLFKVIPVEAARAYFREHKPALVVKAKLPLDNIPRDEDKIVELFVRVPTSEYAELFNFLEKRVSPEVGNDIADAIETLRLAEMAPTGLPVDDLAKNVWTVLMAWLKQENTKEIHDFLFEKSEQDIVVATPPSEMVNEPVVVERRDIEEEPIQVQVRADQNQEQSLSGEILILDEIRMGSDVVVAKLKTPSIFGEVIGVYRAGTWYPMADADTRKRLFPQFGDIFVGHSRPKSDIFTCKVRRTDHAEGKSELRAYEFDSTLLFRVVELDASANNPDAVRDQLKQFAESSTLGRTVFRLTDGLIFRVKPGTIIATAEFNEPLEAWSSLVPYESGHFRILLAPVPPPDTEIDLADIAVLGRRVLARSEEFERLPKFSRSDIADLGRWLRERSDSTSAQRRADQVLDKLDDLVKQKEIASAVVDKMMLRPEIQNQIDARVLEAVTLKEREKGGLTSEIEELNRVRERLKRQVEEDKAKASEAATKIKVSVRKAFEKAVADGEDQVAKAAVMSVLLANLTGRPSTHEPQTSAPFVDGTCVEKIELRSQGSVDDVLATFGLSRSVVKVYVEIIGLAKAGGLVIGFVGAGAAFLADQLSKTLPGNAGVVVQVSPGVNGPLISKDSIQAWGDPDVICVLGANTSSIESYAPILERQIVERIARADAPRKHVIFSLSRDVTSLPLSETLRTATILLDLEAQLPEIDAGLDKDTWGEQIEEALKKHGPIPPLTRRVVRSISTQLSDKSAPEVMTLLKDVLLNKGEAFPLSN